MPTYVYKFVDTGETVEVRQSFKDDTLSEFAHPDSGEVMPVKKVFQPVGVSFKGSGFFKTDNREKSSSNGSSTEPNKAESSSSSDTKPSGSDSSTSSDSKSDSKSSSDSSSTSSSPTTSASKSVSPKSSSSKD